MKNISGIIAGFVCLVNAQAYSNNCRIENKTEFICRCHGTKLFEMSPVPIHKNMTHLLISSCTNVNLDHESLIKFTSLRNIRLQNIRGTLNLEAAIHSQSLERLEILNVSRIPKITESVFKEVSNLTHLRIENTTIESLMEDFYGRNLKEVAIRNVTIRGMEGWISATNGSLLKIQDCSFQRVIKSLHFVKFDRIYISNTIFELLTPRPGVTIEGVNVSLTNNVFLNASVNVVALGSVVVNRTCADGTSTLRIESDQVQSFDNRLPSQIVYASNNTKALKNHVNTVCKGGRCNCPKSAANRLHEMIYLWPCYFLLFLLMLIPKL